MTTSLRRRHFPVGIFVASLCRLLWIYAVDAPSAAYHCPLDAGGLARRWTDENCYWSDSYAEARGKFVALGNNLKGQIASSSLDLDVIDVQSVSYDVGASTAFGMSSTELRRRGHPKLCVRSRTRLTLS